MLSCYCFWSGKFKSPRTEHLSSPLLLSSLPSKSSCLLRCIFFVLSASYRFFVFKCLLSSQRSRTFWGFQGFFATFFPKYHTVSISISHCCIVGGNHGIDVHVLISQSNEWCKFHTYRCLIRAGHIWVPLLLKIKPECRLVWLSRLLQANSKCHHHQVMVTFFIMVFLWQRSLTELIPLQVVYIDHSRKMVKMYKSRYPLIDK